MKRPVGAFDVVQFLTLRHVVVVVMTNPVKQCTVHSGSVIQAEATRLGGFRNVAHIHVQEFLIVVSSCRTIQVSSRGAWH